MGWMEQDHETVKRYPPLRGMQHDVFFVSHDHPEGGQEDGSSKFNDWEAEFAIQLARHFVLQGYEQGEVRTPWPGEFVCSNMFCSTYRSACILSG